MTNFSQETYDHIRSGGAGFIEMPRGLIAVWGKEAVQFLDGMITNDVKTLEDGQQMLAAFPNAQGRLLAAVRVLRQGDRFLIETEEATRDKVFQNLFRFTYAGDFFVEDLSGSYQYIEYFGSRLRILPQFFPTFYTVSGASYFFPIRGSRKSIDGLKDEGVNAVEINSGLFETLRIESGIPKYGVDMDETTIVPELGLDNMISYNKGCYIGQEIIARIHFRGHVAKQLTGLVFDGPFERPSSDTSETLAIQSPDGKNAGRLTSVTYSPKFEKHIALAFVRYEFLALGTELRVGESAVAVDNLPFISSIS